MSDGRSGPKPYAKLWRTPGLRDDARFMTIAYCANAREKRRLTPHRRPLPAEPTPTSNGIAADDHPGDVRICDTCRIEYELVAGHGWIYCVVCRGRLHREDEPPPPALRMHPTVAIGFPVSRAWLFDRGKRVRGRGAPPHSRDR